MSIPDERLTAVRRPAATSMYTSNDLRRLFLEFFASKGHYIHPGISLVPTDPSVFLTIAGVVPFQAMLEGREPAPHPRIASCQRCCRTNDLERVGKLARYHTFFEMLGNWSFGDYFKRESLNWGWEFCTQTLGLSGDRIWATIYPDDDEAYRIWTEEVGLPASRILRLEENWWGPVLETGACGPDSEFYYDLGPEFGCGSPDCRPGCECDRYLEFWNHVFTQFYKHPDGSLTPLEKKNIDTGMGLERLTCIVQNRPSVYETDLFAPILDRVEEILARAGGRTDGPAARSDWRLRVIADHSRAATFLVMDGIYPANVGRGYVLRRIIRRAATFGFLLGIREPFLHEIVPVVVEKMESGYPELRGKQGVILEQIRREESQFARTLDRGVPRFLEAVREGGVVDGAFAWDVYATSGVPFEVMKELAEEHGAAIDEEGYGLARERHSLLSGRGLAEKKSVRALDAPPTEFLGYETLEAEGELLLLLHDEEQVDALQAGEVGAAVLDRTPFYGESGGQIGDTGLLIAGVGGVVVATVLDTQRRGPVFVHYVRVEQGMLHPGLRVTAKVDGDRRDAIRRAHTATHLLHAALRQVLGPHVVQRGSVVEPDRLRFDFAHGEAMTAEEIARVEELVNREVLKDTDVRIEHRTQEEARRLGAMMLFGEKYGEIVRVVQVPGFSTELCGGTHVSRTGAIGLVKITSEGSAAAGVRRVECSTGMGSLAYLRSQVGRLREIAELVGGAVEQVPDRIAALKRQVSELRAQLRARAALAEALQRRESDVDGVRVVTSVLKTAEADAVKQLADREAERLDSGVVVVAGRGEDRVILVAKATEGAIGRGVDAGRLLREVAKRAGGSGGGRPGFAQGAAPLGPKVDEALDAVLDVVESQTAPRPEG